MTGFWKCSLFSRCVDFMATSLAWCIQERRICQPGKYATTAESNCCSVHYPLLKYDVLCAKVSRLAQKLVCLLSTCCVVVYEASWSNAC